ncbi:glycosytransferase [Pseudomonas agarici]|uniref:Glycosytransferase n=1 Tax=Pseudomonas agarici TaxID=46677 RepID=A0A0X1T5Z6_PSEAA|nr:glycosyltransferase [Pseudomonas agarici]AMB87544.1 glycosytransferase [Pseudomonas agarici]
MKTLRVLWLLNHTTLRKFEIEQLRACGVSEIFLPKSFAYDEGNLSASIDFSQDATLSLSAESLAVLNAQDWYSSPSDEAWDIVNRHFDIAIIGFFPKQIESTVYRFHGSVILRVFGLSAGYSYSQLLYEEVGEAVVRKIKSMGARFWFGVGYEHLSDNECHFLADRTCFLPMGLKDIDRVGGWQGMLNKILFVCPRIGSSPYFENIYRTFVRDFAGFDYSVGGAQPIAVSDVRVLGFVSSEQHEYNMKQHKLMFYHSTEPNHIHYHPFEAVKQGMPLLFMAGGMLDKMGGLVLPGRCKSIAEARTKARRLLANDEKLIKSICESQVCLLDRMSAGYCKQFWSAGFAKVIAARAVALSESLSRPRKRKRIGVILPIEYRGGSLRGAILLARALSVGSRQAGEDADIVFLHLDSPEVYSPELFDDVPTDISVRPFRWMVLSRDAARRAMRYAGHEGWEPDSERYLAVDDGIHSLEDCDLWLVVSDRLSAPLLPIKPAILMVYDYLQRYVRILPDGADQPYLDAARRATKVLVTTRFTHNDVLQYAGVAPDKVFKLPMLAPDLYPDTPIFPRDPQAPAYFLWTSNLAMHKNHENALKALKIYYEEMQGELVCFLVGVETEKLLKGDLRRPRRLAELVKKSVPLSKQLTIRGELPDRDYRQLLANAAFLWHAGAIDNGTFSVVEAASLGVPALSSDYPAMREIDQQFSLGVSWMDAFEPRQMAAGLKEMERSYRALRTCLPDRSKMLEQGLEALAGDYWRVVRTCL